MPAIKLKFKDKHGVETNRQSIGRSIYSLEEKQKMEKAFYLLMSHKHFDIIKYSPDEFRIVDTSTNGTYVNGVRVKKEREGERPTLLPNAATIAIGEGSEYKCYVFIKTDPAYQKKDEFPSSLLKKYVIAKTLGSGVSSSVVLAFRKSDNMAVAIKCVTKLTSAKRDLAENEVNKLMSMSHPFIIGLIDYVPTKNKSYLVLEFARQGELFDEIALKGKKNEDVAKFLFYQMVDAIDYMHENDIAHRDLKPENILLCPQTAKKFKDWPIIKIADMGLARDCDQTSMETFCGTLMVIKFNHFRLEF